MSDSTHPLERDPGYDNCVCRERISQPWSRRRRLVWWSQTGSNRRPPACKAGALPTELWPRQRTEDGQQRTDEARFRRLSSVFRRLIMVGLGRFELPTSRLSSARSNQLSYKPGFGGQRTDDRGRKIISLLSSVVCPPSSGSSSFAKKEKRRRRGPASRMTDDRRRRTEVLRVGLAFRQCVSKLVAKTAPNERQSVVRRLSTDRRSLERR